MSNKDKPISEAENNARIEKGLAEGKTIYTRGGNKLRGRKADDGDDLTSPPASPASAAAKVDDKPDAKPSDKSSDRAKG